MGVARCFDWDDYHDGNHDWLLGRLAELRTLNPAFRCTLFAFTAKTLRAEEMPEWVEVAPHGWLHPDPLECQSWTYRRTVELIEHAKKRPRFVRGFKAPGWQVSDESYRAFADHGWWVADQEYNRERRPSGLRVYEIGPDDWHGHVPDVCGNGLSETWREVCALVEETEEFAFVSERVEVTP